MSVVVLDDGIVHYEVLGRGRPIIFLHGWVGSWRYWIPVMQAVSVSFRAYAIDLWGFGDTSKEPRRYKLTDQLRLLDGFLEEMGIVRFAIVGHGLGALLGLLYAQKNPAIVDRVMAVGYPMEESMINPRMRREAPAVLADWLLGKLPGTEPARADAPKTDPLAIEAAFSLMGSKTLSELWRSVTVSCLLVHGQNDLAISPPRLDQLADLPVSMHAVTFEQSGHFPMLDESSKFNRLLIDFLALSSGESPRELQLKEEWKRRIR